MDTKDLKSGLKVGIGVIIEQVELMPKQPGVYKMIGANEKLLYVGKAKNLPKRVISYSKYQNLPNRLRRMVSQIIKIETIVTTTEAEALLLEANLIKSLKPYYNISLKDDKSFPYILIENKHDFPRISKFRGKKIIGNTYFGPFASAFNVTNTITELQKIFKVRPCSDNFFASRKRSCIQYQIKRCSAPCVGKISKEDYSKLISEVNDFLSGKSSSIQERLSLEMETASNELEFEKAAIIRDKIKTLSSIQAKNTMADIGFGDVDIIALHRINSKACIQIFFLRGGSNYGNKAYFYDNLDQEQNHEIIENFIGQFYQNKQAPKILLLSEPIKESEVLEEALKNLFGYKIKIMYAKTTKMKNVVQIALDNAKEALEKRQKEMVKHNDELEKVQKLFNISSEIKRIEVYDNSHVFGSNAVGCMVVYKDYGFEKNEYRRFNIKSTNLGDDYAMLREVLTRRLKKITEENKPDLMLIDGGKGHLSITESVFEELGITDIKFVCISKGEDRNAGREYFHQTGKAAFQLPHQDKTLHFLQVLRDEVHRYAITSHRTKRAKEVRRSVLNEIPSVGSFRKKMLIQYFGSPEAVMNASAEDLVKVRGINKDTAQKIYNHFRGV